MSTEIKRAALWAGIAVLLVLDLLALDDITTAGAWMPEIVMLIASIPALGVLGAKALKGSSEGGKLEESGDQPPSLAPRGTKKP